MVSAAQVRCLLNSVAERIEFLQAHNRFRNDFATMYADYPQPAAANMNRLYWSALLEATAIDYASRCKKLEHGQTGMKDGPAFKDLLAKWGGDLGQNLYMAGGKPRLTSMVFAFANETKNFKYDPNGSGTCEKDKKCGHYTQVVWADTVYVGCGIVKCNPYWLGTCNYAGAGNWAGLPPYKSGTPCSQCTAGKLDLTKCEGNLCVPAGDRCSPITECKVVDKDNCLCSEADNQKIVTDLLTGAKSDDKSGGQTAPTAVILSLVSSAVVFVVVNVDRLI